MSKKKLGPLKLWILSSTIVLFCCVLPKITYAQTGEIDSLRTLLSLRTETKSSILYELGYKFAESGSYDSSLKYAHKALNISKLSSDSMQLTRIARLKAYVFRRLHKMDSAILIANQILQIARENGYDNELKSILNGLGVAYNYEGRFDKALEAYYESLEVRERLGDEFEISVVLLNIGLVYYKLLDFPKALKFFSNSMELKRKHADSLGMSILASNMALCYAYLDNFVEARNYLDQSVGFCGVNCLEDTQVQIHFTRGYIYLAQHQIKDAESEFIRSYAIATRIGDQRFELDNIATLSQIYLQLGNLKLAEDYLSRAEVVINKGTPFNVELIQVYAELSKLHNRLKNFNMASFYQGKYIVLKDSLYGHQFTTNIMKIEAAYQEKENQKKVEAQNEILLLKEQVIYRQRIFNLAVAVVCLLLLFLAFVLWRNIKGKKKINRILDSRVRERTRELEVNRDTLQRAFLERDAIINKASIDIRSSIATIKGLCLLGIKEIQHPNAQDYLEKVDKTSDQLSNVISRIFSPYKIEDHSQQ